ncbi:Heme NO binding protein [Rubripirellula tenax]|uniref:Heme NO binding protein n=1 Tax=Rubripirellula tenax TaxID=2528015 RepID=A0A5C6FHA1_9BACT|nr:heme NO-binding domain-containing protein [Rubripirellula tenax]TWU60250.1 Heme NO binding protein [Rubripirellula tenax]
MKGIVFTELIEMVEEDLGIEIADRMISGAKTANDGSYTSVGTYDHAELIQLVISLSAETGIPVADLVQTFGKHLFARFHELYPQFFAGVDSAIDFLPMVETYIHVEVRKLYPDAELPSFDCESNGGVLSMTYRSKRPFADLAEGLILACVDHYRQPISVTRHNLGKQDGTHACFVLTPTSDVPAQELAS